jgi:hypothetical protein
MNNLIQHVHTRIMPHVVSTVILGTLLMQGLLPDLSCHAHCAGSILRRCTCKLATRSSYSFRWKCSFLIHPHSFPNRKIHDLASPLAHPIRFSQFVSFSSYDIAFPLPVECNQRLEKAAFASNGTTPGEHLETVIPSSCISFIAVNTKPSSA